MYKKIILTVMMSFILGASQSAFAGGWDDMTADEITAAFSGKTAWGQHAKKDKRNMVYFAPDGTFVGKRLDEKGGGEGKWSVDGSNLCMEKEGDTKCRRVAQKKNKIRKYKGDKYVWKYTKFKDGNHVSK